jgi:hypothetical protein
MLACLLLLLLLLAFCCCHCCCCRFARLSFTRMYNAQSRQSAKLFLLSSDLGLPQPLTRRRVCYPPPPAVLGGGAHSLERGVGSPNSDEGTYTVVLFIYTYFVVQRKLKCLATGLLQWTNVIRISEYLT